MLFDLHVHTTFSPCSVLRPDVVFDTARALGLDGVCITDHDTRAMAGVLREYDTSGLCVVVGMEYTSPDGDFLIFGPVGDLALGMRGEDLLPLVHARGGAAVAAHPFRPGRSVAEYVVQTGLCRIVESRNGRNRREDNQRVREWLDRYDLHATGGSDAHTPEELGQVPTFFDVPIRCEADLVSALNAGRCRAVSSLREFTARQPSGLRVVKHALQLFYAPNR